VLTADRTCKARNENGDPCRQAALRDGDFCFWRDPDHAQEAQEARRLGGLRRRREKAVSGAYDFEGLGSIEQIRRLLEIAVLDTLGLENSVARSRTLAYLSQVSLKALEVGELDEKGPGPGVPLAATSAGEPIRRQRSRLEVATVSIAGRLNRLNPALAAKERAILALQACKEGVPEDPELRVGMSAGQASEFNHLINLMRGTYDVVSLYVIILGQSLDLLNVRYGWLLSLHLWALGTMNLGAYIALHTKEPITHSQYKRRLAAARREMVPASEFAEILADQCEGWAAEDLEPPEGEGEPLVKQAAWKRVCRQKARELARRVEEGALLGTRKGRRLYVNAGSFYDWLGEPAPVFPDWGFEFDILPDRKAGEVRRLRQARQDAREAVQSAPVGLGLDLVSRKLCVPPKGPAGGNELAEALATHLREGIALRWRELLAVEQILDEIGTEFDGEDPARPQERRAITEGKEQLKELHEQVQEYVGPFELASPDEPEIAQCREAIRRAAD
jgi:hypothetical protein